jgi:hypothetical protein
MVILQYLLMEIVNIGYLHVQLIQVVLHVKQKHVQIMVVLLQHLIIIIVRIGILHVQKILQALHVN